MVLERGVLLRAALACGNAVGVDPGVELHAALVGLADEPGQRVPARIAAALAAEILRPGLIRRGVEGVGHGAHLKQYGIDMMDLQGVEAALIVLLLPFDLGSGGGVAVGPVDVADGGHPYATEVLDRQYGRRDGRGGVHRPGRCARGLVLGHLLGTGTTHQQQCAGDGGASLESFQYVVVHSSLFKPPKLRKVWGRKGDDDSISIDN